MDITTPSLDALLTAPDFAEDPYPALAVLREEAPVFWSEGWHTWVVTRYDDCVAGMRDHSRLSHLGRRAAFFDELPDATRKQIEPLYQHFSEGMGNLDPPDHTRLRSVASSAFRKRAIEPLRQQVEELTDKLIGQLAVRSRVDLISEFAVPLPLAVITDFLELPAEDGDRLKAWSDEFVLFMGTGGAQPEVVERSLRAFLEAREWLLPIVADAKPGKKNGLMQALLETDEGVEPLTEDEIIAMLFLLMVGGHESSTSLIAVGILSLLRHPGEMARLREQPELAVSAVEELLRYEGPVQQGWRVASTDLEMRGKSIRKGEMVRFMLGSANRDPRFFENPDTLDIARNHNRHVAFGMGIHACLGAPLARLEGEIAIPALLERFPDLRLADDDLEWKPNEFLRGLEALNLELR